jgi:hypothetical protein
LQQNSTEGSNEILVGFSGNLLRPDIDREILLEIIRENPAVIFECWGSYELKNSNIGGTDDLATTNFIKELKGLRNLRLNGAIPVEKLAQEYQRMSAFLICYDVQKDQSKGTNYHKVLEFISTGKVTIANNITTYQNKPELVRMVNERDSNKNLPGLFKEIIQNLSIENADNLITIRKQFAADNTYAKQVERIGEYLSQIKNEN